MSYTTAVINLQNLQSNLRVMENHLGIRGKICPMIKADAYGHGDIQVARALERWGIEYLGVSSWYEASRLREAGVSTKIIQFCPARYQDLEHMITSNIEMVVSEKTQIADIAEKAMRLGNQAKVHLKVDVGMHRLGCRIEQASELLLAAEERPALLLAGICTHLPNGEQPNNQETRAQIGMFRDVVEELLQHTKQRPLIHIANSATLCNYPIPFQTLARPGIGLYGYHPEQSVQERLLPVMTLHSRLMAIKRLQAGESCSYSSTWRTKKDTTIGVVATGYGDGYPRLLSNRGRVAIEGKFYPIVGNICMDLLMVDLGEEMYPLETRVTLFGEGGPSAEEVAAFSGTIVYEVLCSLSKRVQRIYT